MNRTERSSIALVTGAFLLSPAAAARAAVPAGFTDALFVSVASPTDLAFTPDGRMLVTSQGGALRVYDGTGALLGTQALPAGQVCSNSERGLLGVAVDPNHAANRYVYLFYTRRKPGGDCATASPITPLTAVNRVSRFVLPATNVLDLASEVVLVDEMPSPGGNHNAGDLAFGRDGYLYVSIGDGGCDYAGGGCAGANDASRDENVLTGKILRLAVNGDGTTSIPPTNPFQGADSERCALTGRTVTPGKTRCRETFAWGLRNPFRFAMDPNAAGTRLFIDDVGQNTREEIDLGQAGADYGWNCKEGSLVTGACGSVPAGVVDPIYDYGRGAVTGTTASGCASVTGGAFVPNGIWPAAYDGTYLFADFVCGWIFRLSAGGPYAAADFATSLGGSSATSLAFGPHGTTQALYYTTYAAGGQVRRIAYALPGNNPPVAVASGGPLTGPVPLAVTFSAAGSSDPDPADTLTYFWTFGDGSPEQSTTSLTVQHTYVTAGTWTAALRVRDDKLAFSSPATLLVQPDNTPPVAAIQSPAPGATFAVGQAITLTGTGTDAQDGSLPASRLSWTVLLHHDTHVHPFLGPVTGNGVVFVAPAPEDLAAAETSHLEVRLTATDLSGATHTVSRDLLPRKVGVTFATTPPGLSVFVNGFPLTAPRTVTSWQDWALQAFAPSSQASGPDTYVFSSWTGGPANPLLVATPAAPTTYTATFQLSIDQGTQAFHTLAPCRVLDTRLAAGALGGPALAAGVERAFDVRGACGIPPGARAVAVNLTVTGASAPGNLRLWATGEPPPGTSTINFAAGQTRANDAVLRLGANGSFSVVYGAAHGSTHLVVDVAGYFE
ncbi:MAG TPA: PQQ-dependent sugar dehydrogenase [Vicinamibacteria bacterium]|nr:PQQ-dependent sugar dehydrogenase [Vicinamibacteria bacterium]